MNANTHTQRDTQRERHTYDVNPNFEKCSNRKCNHSNVVGDSRPKDEAVKPNG